MKRFVLALALALVCPQAHSEITEEDFDATLHSFQDIYVPKLHADLNLGLHFESFWTRRSMIVSSQARRVGDEAIVFIDGDLARKPDINKAAFVLSVCHEFGHIYGDVDHELKLTREGKADYWAAGCAIHYFSKMASEGPAQVPGFLKARCHANWEGAYESCLQVASGIQAYARHFKIDIEQGVNSDLNDRVANGSFHPLALCRVKTFIAGLFGDEKPQCIYSIRVSEFVKPRPINVLITYAFDILREESEILVISRS